MATGIVSAATRRVGATDLSVALLIVTAASFIIVLAASALRAAWFPADLVADLSQPSRAFTCFAFVAASDVLASDLAGEGRGDVAAGLAACAVVIWVALTVLVPGRLIGRVVMTRSQQAQARPMTTSDINGSWYLWVVGTQSLVIAAVALKAGRLIPAEPARLAAIAAWSAGAAGYLAVTALVITRLWRVGLARQDPTAPYWVAMGAASITVLAASGVLGTAGLAVGDGLRAAIGWLAICFWALASALIPPLVARSAWRHLAAREPLRYRLDLWMVIFPAGMYAMSSMRLGQVVELPFITHAGAAAALVATAGWALALISMIVFAVSRTGHRDLASVVNAFYHDALDFGLFGRIHELAEGLKPMSSAPSRQASDDDAPGDPACLLRRVCPRCGSVADSDPPTTCPQCHADMPAD